MDFLVLLLLLISNFILLWSKKILFSVIVFKNLLVLNFFPKIWSILINVPCALEKNVCSIVLSIMFCPHLLDSVG